MLYNSQLNNFQGILLCKAYNLVHPLPCTRSLQDLALESSPWAVTLWFVPLLLTCSSQQAAGHCPSKSAHSRETRGCAGLPEAKPHGFSGMFCYIGAANSWCSGLFKTCQFHFDVPLRNHLPAKCHKTKLRKSTSALLLELFCFVQRITSNQKSRISLQSKAGVHQGGKRCMFSEHWTFFQRSRASLRSPRKKELNIPFARTAG